MTTLTLGRWMALACLALLAGIYLGDGVGTAHARATVDPAAFVQMQQAIHQRFVRLMPPLLLACAVGHGLWLWSLRDEVATASFWLVLLVLVGIIAIAVLTRVVNAPLNRQLMHWSVSAPPAGIRELWRPWEAVNRIRLAIATIGLAIELGLVARLA